MILTIPSISQVSGFVYKMDFGAKEGAGLMKVNMLIQQLGSPAHAAINDTVDKIKIAH